MATKRVQILPVRFSKADSLPFIKLLNAWVDFNRKQESTIVAELEVDVVQDGALLRKSIIVEHYDHLMDVTKNPMYESYIIDVICYRSGEEFVEIQGVPGQLALFMTTDEIDRRLHKKRLIRKTMEIHLERELALSDRGIKVLSLFLLNDVQCYRAYSKEGDYCYDGLYHWLLREVYLEIIGEKRFSSLYLGLDQEEKLLDRRFKTYFEGKRQVVSGKRVTVLQDSMDPKKGSRVAKRLQRDREKLLAPENVVRFLVSHVGLSEALRHANIFQICLLRDEPRGENEGDLVKPGLDLCVDQGGEVVMSEDVNVLSLVVERVLNNNNLIQQIAL
ncbi:hypothetical protein ACQZV8_06585 [Magnetococcales bacterium HHB-1]